MIIESGNDLRLILESVEQQPERRGLRIVALDEELRLITVITLFTDSGEIDVVGSIPAVAGTLFDEAPNARYAVLAWATDRVTGDVGWLRGLDERIRDDGLLEPVRLLGQIAFAAGGTSTTVPQGDFTLYPELRDLPRSVSIPGPHGDGCSCAVCQQEPRFFEPERSDLEYAQPHPWPYREPYPLPYSELYSPPYPEEYRSGDEDYEYSRARERLGPTFHARRPSLFTQPGAAPVAEADVAPYFDPFWNRWYPAPERSYKKWTRDEEVALERAHAEGMSCFDISILLRRQPGAIASRLNRLGLSARTVVPGEDGLPDPDEHVGLPETRRATGGQKPPPTLFDD